MIVLISAMLLLYLFQLIFSVEVNTDDKKKSTSLLYTRSRQTRLVETLSMQELIEVLFVVIYSTFLSFVLMPLETFYKYREIMYRWDVTILFVAFWIFIIGRLLTRRRMMREGYSKPAHWLARLFVFAYFSYLFVRLAQQY